MPFNPVRWSLCGLWLSIALLTFLFLDPSSARSWLTLAAVSVIPPVILLRVWNDRPPVKIASAWHATEARR